MPHLDDVQILGSWACNRSAVAEIMAGLAAGRLVSIEGALDPQLAAGLAAELEGALAMPTSQSPLRPRQEAGRPGRVRAELSEAERRAAFQGSCTEVRALHGEGFQFAVHGTAGAEAPAEEEAGPTLREWLSQVTSCIVCTVWLIA